MINVLQTSRKLGMQTLDDAIEEHIKKRIIDPMDGFEKAIQKERFVPYLKSVPEEYRELLSNKSEKSAPAEPARAAKPNYSGSGRPASRPVITSGKPARS